MTQEITITVPASFDAAAQRLTLNAAEEAGFPGSVRLLEEPQAAFYCWLERHGSAEPLWEGLDPHNAEPRHVLIVDIGGGTSDFSLFELRPGASGGIPDITRVAVSEHILLGGDNIDLALAVLTGTAACGGTRPDFRPTMGSPRRVMSRSERARAFGSSARRMSSSPWHCQAGGPAWWPEHRRQRWRATRSSGWCWMGFFRYAMRAPGPIEPRQVCAIGDFPTLPTAR